MKAHALARELLKMPDLDVWYIWDGAARTEIDYVWVANGDKNKGGKFIATVESNSVVYSDSDRPDYAPKSKDNRYWESHES